MFCPASGYSFAGLACSGVAAGWPGRLLVVRVLPATAAPAALMASETVEVVVGAAYRSRCCRSGCCRRRCAVGSGHGGEAWVYPTAGDGEFVARLGDGDIFTGVQVTAVRQTSCSRGCAAGCTGGGAGGSGRSRVAASSGVDGSETR